MAVRKKTWLLLSVSNRPLINGNVSLVLECGVKVKNVGKLFLRLFASCAVLPPFFFVMIAITVNVFHWRTPRVHSRGQRSTLLFVFPSKRNRKGESEI